MHPNLARGKAVRAVSASIAFVALMSSILAIGLPSIAGAASVTTTFQAGQQPLDIAINPTGTLAYVANFMSNSVSVIQLSDDSVVATILVGTGPSRVALDPTDTFAYVSNFTSGSVSVIDLSTNTVTATVTLPTGANPEQIAVTSSDAYVTDRGTNSISVIALPSDTLTTPLASVTSPEGIVVVGADAYVTDRTDGAVSVIKLSDGSLVGTIPVGGHATRIASNPAGSFLYVTNNTPNNVSVIQTSTNTVVATIPVGNTPDAVAVDPTGTYAYVSNAGSPPSVSVIQLSTNTVIQTLTVGNAPEGIAVNPADTFAYVVNLSSNNVSVISLTSTVTFGANGGTGTMANETKSIPTALTSNAFVNTGFAFNGWNTAADGTGTTYANGASYPFTASTTLYAQWTPVVASATVTFDANGGTGTMANETNTTATALTANAFTKTGFTFSGWNTNVAGTGTTYANGASYSFTASTTLYAQWTPTVTSHTVTFYGNGSTGGTMAAETSSSASALTANAFTKTGYTFAGWNTAPVGGGTAYANGAIYPFAANTSLYAQWTAVVTNFTVAFDANGGTGTMASETHSAAAALTPNAFTRLGYTFSGWNTAANGTGTTYANGASYPFTASATLYAQWTAVVTNHTVTFDPNGGTGTMANETHSAAAPLTLNAFTNAGYTFSGWNTATNGTGTAYANGASYPFTASTTLYAQWTPLTTFTVTFDPNGGTGTMANETGSAPKALSNNAFTRSGYTFSGWNTSANGAGAGTGAGAGKVTAYANGAIYPFAASITLYAQWTAVVTNHTVTFDANGGTGTMANETQGAAAPLTLNAFTRPAYTFSGWNTAANGTGTAYADGASYPFTASTTLYAQWTAKRHDGNGNEGRHRGQGKGHGHGQDVTTIWSKESKVI